MTSEGTNTEIYVGKDEKVWTEGDFTSAYLDNGGIVVEDWGSVNHVDGSSWIEVTMHLLDESDELDSAELCRVRDALQTVIPYGFDPDRDHGHTRGSGHQSGDDVLEWGITVDDLDRTYGFDAESMIRDLFDRSPTSDPTPDQPVDLDDVDIHDDVDPEEATNIEIDEDDDDEDDDDEDDDAPGIEK